MMYPPTATPSRSRFFRSNLEGAERSTDAHGRGTITLYDPTR
jgi:hypothetical protein